MTPKLFSPWHLPKLLLSASKEPMSTMVECEKKVNYGSRLTMIENGPIDIERVMQKEFAEADFNF
jgi:hypothetical protein